MRTWTLFGVGILACVAVGWLGCWAADAADVYQPEVVRLARLGDGMEREQPKPDVLAAEAAPATLDHVVKDRSGPHLLATGEAVYMLWGGIDEGLLGTAAVEYEVRGVRFGIMLVAGEGYTDCGPRISSDIAATGDLIAMMCGKDKWAVPDDLRFVLARVTYGLGYLVGEHRGGAYVGFVPIEVQFDGP